MKLRNWLSAIGICLVVVSWLLVIPLVEAQLKAEAETPAKAPRPLWGTYGMEINNTPGNTPQQNPRIASAADGGFLIIWEDGRAGYTRIYAQKIDGIGNKLWPEAGIGACSRGGNQNFAQLVEDGSGGMIVVWQGYCNGNADLFAQHISARGQLLWGGEGIVVCSAEAGQLAPELVPDGSGGVIVTWYDYRSGTGEDVYAQRIDKNGSVLWKENGVPISLAPGTQWYPKIASDGMGGAIIVWADGRESSADNNIYGQRVDAAGKILWEKDGIPVCSEPQNQERPVILAVENGAIVAWNDARSENLDIYCQKIGLDGKPLWTAAGIAATTAPFNQTSPRLAPDGSGGAIVAWTDNRQEESAIYAQRITSSGQPNWEDNGRLIAKSPAKQENPEIIKLKDLDWAIVWEDYRKGTSLLFAQKVNSAGIPLWQEGGIALAYGAKAQEKASLALSPAGDLLVVWQDRRRGNFDIYAQKILPEGNLVWEENELVICEAAGLVIHQNPSMVESGRGEVILVFEDARSGYLNIYAQKIGKDGTLLWGKDGIPLAKVKADQINPQLVSDGAEGAIVCWEDQRNPRSSKIYAQRIGSSGKKVWEGGSLALSKLDSQQNQPVMVSDGHGGAIIVWQDDRDPLSLKDLYGQRVSGGGELLWGKNSLAICSENGEQVENVIVTDGAGGAILAWTDYRRGERNPDIYAQRLDGNGKPLWQKEGVLACGAPDIQKFPQLTKDKEGGAVVAWTDKGGGSYDIYAQRLSREGKTLWLTDGIPINQSARTQQNPLLGERQIFVWEDYRYGNWDIFANAVSLQGKVLWGEDGIPVVSLPLTQYAPQIANWKGEGLIIAWEDYRNGKQYEIFTQKINNEGKSEWPKDGVLVKTTNGARAPKLLALPRENSLVIVWEDHTGGGKAIFGQKFKVD